MICAFKVTALQPSPTRLILDLTLLGVPPDTPPADQPPHNFTVSFDLTQPACERWLREIFLPTLNLDDFSALPGTILMSDFTISGANGARTYALLHRTIAPCPEMQL